MSDLIDRQKALNVIKRMRAYIGHNMERAVGAAFIEILDDVGEDIGRLPSAQPATDTNVGTKLVIDPHKIERAIRGLTEWQKHVQTESDIDRDIFVAVEALKAQLGTNLAEVGMDCISRQAAIDAVLKCYDNNELFEVYERELKELPSAEPERKKGKWIEYEQEFMLEGHTETVQKTVRECSVCTAKIAGMVGIMNFCPNCGAKMEVTT